MEAGITGDEKMNQQKFRHEIKHFINFSDSFVIRSRLKHIMTPDAFALEDGKYKIRSLYFDNLQDKAYMEKINGINNREKFRTRFYNDNTSLIRLEKKSKINGLCQKNSVIITESECRMLLMVKEAGYLFHEVDIHTVYNKNNKAAHFQTIKDSARVYQQIIKFCASSLTSAIIDLTLLFLIQLFTSNLLISVIASRICSSVFNYSMNRTFVFSSDKSSNFKNSIFKYFTLVIIVMIFNYSLLFAFNKLIGAPLFISKLLTETTIFLFSYWSQHKFVFAH